MKIRDISRNDLERITKESSSFSEILQKISLTTKGSGNYRTLQDRLSREEIDFSHITRGLGHSKGKSLSHSSVIPLSEILIENSTYTSVPGLKKRLIKDGILTYQCEKCGLGAMWNGEKITLQLDHINGNRKDNRVENLRILCPNCHTQTATYGSKRGLGRGSRNNYRTRANKYVENRCIDCSQVISVGHTRCLRCAAKQRENIGLNSRFRKVKDRPSKEILMKEIEDMGYCGVGRKYGVSDNAIRKWIK